MGNSPESQPSWPSQWKQPTDEDLIAVRQRWLDPVIFSREVLGIEVWSRQQDLLRAVASHSKTAVRSGHKVSKSWSAAALGLWWTSVMPRAKTVMTSSSDNQVATILWPEVRKLHKQARIPLGGDMAVSHRTGWRLEDGRTLFGFTTDKAERMAGQSGENLLYIIDEASGVDEAILEAIEGNLAGGGRVVMFSNPTQTSGGFYDAFHNKRQFWHQVHISSTESPNVTGLEPGIPGLAAKAWVDEKRALWGEDSLLYAVRVLGNFPGRASDVLIGLDTLEGALKRWPTAKAEGRLQLGVDVARFGDDESVIFPRRGGKALAPIVMRGKDAPDLAGEVLKVAHDLRQLVEVPQVKVDAIGVGAGVYDILRRSDRVEAFAVNVSESATAEGYHRLRDQLWGGLNDWMKAGGALPPDSKLEGELVAPKYGFDTRGQLLVESKDDLKKRLGRSPDRADALALAVYEPPTKKRVVIVGGGLR